MPVEQQWIRQVSRTAVADGIAKFVDLPYIVDMDNNNYQRDEHRVHLIVYHLVWTPSGVKAVLVNEIGAGLQNVD